MSNEERHTHTHAIKICKVISTRSVEVGYRLILKTREAVRKKKRVPIHERHTKKMGSHNHIKRTTHTKKNTDGFLSLSYTLVSFFFQENTQKEKRETKYTQVCALGGAEPFTYCKGEKKNFLFLLSSQNHHYSSLTLLSLFARKAK